MNPIAHNKALLGILMIVLTALAVACGTTATNDSAVDSSPGTSAALETTADAHNDGDAHTAESVSADTHNDGDAHTAESVAADTHDGDAHDESAALDTHHDGDAHDESPAIEVSLSVVEGKTNWHFTPEVIEVPLGQPVKLTLNNNGRAEHDIEISNLKAEHIERMVMAGMAGHDHDATVVAAHAMPGTAASVIFTPMEPGEYEFHCTLPGHRELGMVGKIIVTNNEA